MCGCTSSSQYASQQYLNQQRLASTKSGFNSSSVTMPESNITISNQLASIKALEKASDLEKAIATAVLVFHNYKGPDGKLTKTQVKNVLLSEFQNFLQGQETKPKYKEIFSHLEEDKDRNIDFEDFMVLLISFTVMSDLMNEIQNAESTK
ncbi:sentan [Latimeria chalumnae]|uniref:sentan n=1 Tax=Latimeria chalumnae TaxID=7897 RepID=UPI0003C18B7E|nr:PREDICTED: sentan [Latimeria chalumnae]|eukprot:XP_006001187.1 PREDICTED: sentan [Latimeria chalumnae]